MLGLEKTSCIDSTGLIQTQAPTRQLLVSFPVRGRGLQECPPDLRHTHHQGTRNTEKHGEKDLTLKKKETKNYENKCFILHCI